MEVPIELETRQISATGRISTLDAQGWLLGADLGVQGRPLTVRAPALASGLAQEICVTPPGRNDIRT